MMNEGDSPLDFLLAVYKNNELPLSTRMRAAIEAAPYVHAKLAVQMNVGENFADKLEQVIQRRLARAPNGMKVIEAKPIEAKPVESFKRRI
jgi:hypothetical protein